MKITKETKIKDLIPEGYELNDFTWFDDGIKSENSPSLLIALKKKEKTPEEMANELGFKIGDKCWQTHLIATKNPEYIGKITEFFNNSENSLCIKLTQNEVGILIAYITNKVAIHCPTKEDFEFIYKVLNKKFQHSNIEVYLPDVAIFINDDKFTSIKEKFNTTLIISIGDYMQSQGIKPLGKTVDNKNAYEGMGLWQIIDGCGQMLSEPNKINCPSYAFLYKYEFASTEQAAQQYLENSKILFYTEDFADGSFPEKSCELCPVKDSLGYFNCISCKNFSYFKGELKGEPIRKDDKCFMVDEEDVVYYYFDGNKDTKKTKYFSNETNAEIYYRQLQIEHLNNQIKNLKNGRK